MKQKAEGAVKKNKILIIAEAGVNHNGNLSLAKHLIDVAAEAGADVVKFQTFKSEKLVSRFAEKAEYQKKGDGDNSQLAMLRKLELNEEQLRELQKYAREKKIEFLSTPFDLDSIQTLKKLGIKTGKIPSGEITNYPYLVKMAKSFRKIILSTGMCDMNDIDAAIKVLLKNGTKKNNITVLHCNTEYPTPMNDVNLRAMPAIAKRFKTAVGYSDHTAGIEVAIAAAVLGASVLEKHFTLDKNMEGPDHAASLDPAELKAMIAAVRNIQLALGSSQKKVSVSEKKNMKAARKSLVAKCEIKKGDFFSEQNLTVKRPGNGISPMKWKEVLGKRAKKSFEEDELITL